MFFILALISSFFNLNLDSDKIWEKARSFSISMSPTRKSIAFKEAVIDFFYDVARESKRATAKEFKISRKMVRSYLKQEDKIRDSASKRSKRHIVVYARRPKYAELEAQVFDWYKAQRQKKVSVTGNDLRETMRRLVSNNHPTSRFACSNGWLNNFLRRHRLSRRRVTTFGMPLPTNSVEIIRSFLGSVEGAVVGHNYAPNAIFNFGNLACYENLMLRQGRISIFLFSKMRAPSIWTHRPITPMKRLAASALRLEQVAKKKWESAACSVSMQTVTSCQFSACYRGITALMDWFCRAIAYLCTTLKGQSTQRFLLSTSFVEFGGLSCSWIALSEPCWSLIGPHATCRRRSKKPWAETEPICITSRREWPSSSNRPMCSYSNLWRQTTAENGIFGNAFLYGHSVLVRSDRLKEHNLLSALFQVCKWRATIQRERSLARTRVREDARMDIRVLGRAV